MTHAAPCLTKSVFLVALLTWCAGCQCARLEDYKVCGVTFDCVGASDGGEEDGGVPDAGQDDAGPADAGPCVPDGSVDALDALGDDSDCDGVDGVRARQLYVAGSRGDDLTAEPGNPLRPFATLSAAFAVARLADAGTFDAVLVTTGQYAEEDLSWDFDLDVWGGRTGTGTWAATGAPTSLVGGNVGLVVQGVQGRGLHEFQVRAGPAEFSKASIAAVVVDGAPRFVDVELVGGAGGPGLDGTNELLPDAGPGLAGTATTQGLFEPNVGPPGVCGGAPGYAGGAAAKGSGDGKAGDGPDGGAGGPARTCPITVAFTAGDGAAGAAGFRGAPGADAVNFGALGNKWAWVGADGRSGTPGATGEPGSGGGGGGAGLPGDPDPSWSGGSGGSGGCPGGGGGAGTTGGPSFGLMIRGGRPVLSGRTTVQAGRGGNGGAGAAGGNGFPGGPGGVGGQQNSATCLLSPSLYGAGGTGGTGGAGGPGGPGGGGAGGHSIAVFCEGDAGLDLVDVDAGVLLAGQAGDGGAGLPGARSGLAAPAWGCSP